MATLIRIGKTYINLDNVTSIDDLVSNHIRVYFATGNFADAYDADAATLRAWLDWQARDIAAELAGRFVDAEDEDGDGIRILEPDINYNDEDNPF
jgi:hypothetical protein